MTFMRFIDRLERFLDLILYYVRKLFPRRPSWFKFSVICLMVGAGLFSAPWWVPFVAEIFGITLEAFGY